MANCCIVDFFYLFCLFWCTHSGLLWFCLQSNIEKNNVLQPTEKSGDDVSLVSMKNKEIISLDIPLNDTGSAGLGVSVKGKTIPTPGQGTRDSGIFIKAVINGGAASRVK